MPNDCYNMEYNTPKDFTITNDFEAFLSMHNHYDILKFDPTRADHERKEYLFYILECTGREYLTYCLFHYLCYDERVEELKNYRRWLHESDGDHLVEEEFENKYVNTPIQPSSFINLSKAIFLGCYIPKHEKMFNALYAFRATVGNFAIKVSTNSCC